MFEKKHIIFLNGAASAGKSSIASSLAQLLARYETIAFDDYLEVWRERSSSKGLRLSDEEKLDAVADDFYKKIAARVSKGNDAIVDDVLYKLSWSRACVRQFAGFDVTLVKVYCPLAIIEARERQRVDGDVGEAREQFYSVHRNKCYDLVVDTSRMSPGDCAAKIQQYSLLSKDRTVGIERKFLGRKVDS